MYAPVPAHDASSAPPKTTPISDTKRMVNSRADHTAASDACPGENPAPDVIRGRHRFVDDDMRKIHIGRRPPLVTSTSSRADPRRARRILCRQHGADPEKYQPAFDESREMRVGKAG